MKSIGIIGGAGPEAGGLLFNLIIQECQKKHEFKNDKDFPEILLLSFPFDGMLCPEKANKNKVKIANDLQKCIGKLTKCKIDICAIACNTLHSFINSINLEGLEFLHIIKNVLTTAKDKDKKNSLVLATSTTVKNKLFEMNDSSAILYPQKHNQEKTDEIIGLITAGQISQKSSLEIKSIIDQELIKNPSIDSIILGCTELSVINESYLIQNENILVLDTLKTLAQALVKKSVQGSFASN
jgi:aspartate racemase